jgi:hypothetical protein
MTEDATCQTILLQIRERNLSRLDFGLVEGFDLGRNEVTRAQVVFSALAGAESDDL